MVTTLWVANLTSLIKLMRIGPNSMKKSGLQKQVVHLYKTCIRQAYKKPIETRENWLSFVHGEFFKYKDIPKKQFGAIEHLIRQGNRRFEMYLNDQIKDIH